MPDPTIALLTFGVGALGLTLLFWPGGGVVARLQRLAHLGERVQLEDALKHVYTCQRTRHTCSLESVAGRLQISRARAATLLARLTDIGLIRTGGHGPELTDDGRRSAIQLVRTHRMWERYLADRTGVPAREWHDEAERMEHALSTDQVDALDARLGHPAWDPHGDPIPTSTGEIPPQQGTSLVTATPGRTVEVVHLEDEPAEIYDTLLDDGLTLGNRLQVVQRTERSVDVRAGGRQWSIPLVAAGNVTVKHLPVGEPADPQHATLGDAEPGETVHVRSISGACQGAQRRRLLDLGLVPGTPVTRELTSATGDPVAYRIRGALIALRRSQAEWIRIDRPATARPARLESAS